MKVVILIALVALGAVLLLLGFLIALVCDFDEFEFEDNNIALIAFGMIVLGHIITVIAATMLGDA